MPLIGSTPSKRSERLRIKSAKGSSFSSHGEEFVYDFGEEEEATARPRSGSWSAGSGAAAIVERRISNKTPSKLVNNVKKVKRELSKNFQEKYKQRRIDLLLLQQKDLQQKDLQTRTEVETDDDEEVYFKVTTSCDVTAPRQSIVQPLPGCLQDKQLISTSAPNLLCIQDLGANSKPLSGEAVNTDYGSDFESVTGSSPIGSISANLLKDTSQEDIREVAVNQLHQ